MNTAVMIMCYRSYLFTVLFTVYAVGVTFYKEEEKQRQRMTTLLQGLPVTHVCVCVCVCVSVCVHSRDVVFITLSPQCLCSAVIFVCVCVCVCVHSSDVV